MMTDRTYTLTEAKVELAKRECLERGHYWTVIDTFARNPPTHIICETCGWMGGVTMGERP